MKKSLVICLFLYQTACAYECIPSTCTVDVIESGEYTFGFTENDAFTKCTYRTNTGLTGTIEINAKKTEELNHETKRNNQISDYGKLGLCQLKVTDVDDTSPTFWTLTPFSNSTSLQGVNFTVNFFYKVSLLLNKVLVMERESFYQYFNSSSLKFLSCKVTFGQHEVDLNVNEASATTDPRVSSLGKGLCGFLVTNVSLEDPADWTLFAKDSTEKPYKESFQLVVYNRPNTAETNIKQFVAVGDSLTITCGEELNQEFCSLYNPLGDFVITNRNCRYNIKTVAVHDFGTWICKIGKNPSIQTLTYKYQLVAKDNFRVRSWLIEDNDYINIGCQLIDFNQIEVCKMVFPSGEALIVRSGSAFGRYMSLGTDYNNATCSLMIKKPLTDADKGQWRCEIPHGQSRLGGLINVGNFTPSRFTTNKTVTVQLGQALDIQCEVPYSSDYCYIKSPNGSQYPVKDNRESSLGICSISINHIKPEDVGYWRCYFARQTGIPDDEVTVKVQVSEILSQTTNIEVPSGGNASLMCSSQGLPLQYCRFVAPNTVSYFIENHQNSSRISYNGKGLEYGECGITITNVATSDSGNWTCITRVGNNFNQNEVFATINVQITPTFLENPATAIGFGVAGGIIIAGVVVFFVFRQWKKRRFHLPTCSYDNTDIS